MPRWYREGQTLRTERGHTSDPDRGIGEAKALLEQRYDAGFPPFWERSHWTLPALPEAVDGQGTTYAKHDSYAIDARGVAYTYAYIAIKRLGAGQSRSSEIP